MSAFFVILATEVGDKTFFIAAILTMRHPRLFVWSGAVGALALMTVRREPADSNCEEAWPGRPSRTARAPHRHLTQPVAP